MGVILSGIYLKLTHLTQFWADHSAGAMVEGASARADLHPGQFIMDTL